MHARVVRINRISRKSETNPVLCFGIAIGADGPVDFISCVHMNKVVVVRAWDIRNVSTGKEQKKRKKRETAFAILYIRNKSKIDIYIRFPYFHKIGRCSFHAGSFAGQNYILSFKIFFAPIWREKVLFIIYGRVDITVYFVRFIFKDLKLFKYKKFIF